jgi:hypothetical protein
MAVVRPVANRTLVGILLVLLALWEASILLGALKAVTTDMAPSPHPCHSCAP